MSITSSSPLTWTDIARRFAAEANKPGQSGGVVRRARLGRYGVVLEVREGVGAREVTDWLGSMFPGRVEASPLALRLEGPEHVAVLPVELEPEEGAGLFRPSFGLIDGTIEFDAVPLTPKVGRPVPVVAALSIKGGTGRTTTAVALGRRWAEVSRRPVLLVDADLEAPGISYLLREQVAEASISLEDAIVLAHAERTEDSTATVAFCASKLQDHLVAGNLFVMPLRRDVDELVGSAVRPEHLSTPSNPFAFADLLANIARQLGCSGVVIDVRAGLVPITVNLAMDPEVSLLIVTTLADQSIRATTALVRFLSQETRRSGFQPRRPLLIVNRVPSFLRHTGMDQRLVEPLASELVGSLVPESHDEVEAGQSIFDSYPPIEPFAQVFVPELPEMQTSAATWSGFLDQISSSGFSRTVGPALDQWIETELLSGSVIQPVPTTSGPDNDKGRRRLAAYADDMIAAENTEAPIQRPLVTQPLAALAERFLSEVPIAVSEGAKGTGKTLAARFFVAQRTWDRVVSKLVDRTGAVAAFILPVCASIQSSARLQEETDRAREVVASSLGLHSPMLVNATTDFLKQTINAGAPEQAWVGYWLDVIAWSAGFEPGIKGAGDRFIPFLRDGGKNVIAVLEGLEELYQSVEDPNVGVVMRAALVGVVQRLRAELKRPLGLVIFARRDTTEASIKQNLDQFRREYSRFALTWTDDDILELAAWLASEAGAIPGLWDADFTHLSTSERTLKLERLWGRKLGPDDKPEQRSREAYTATWVIAVLSDLRRRLVPRDLIRLLANAARISNDADEGTEYESRLLIPRAIRAAIEPTSEYKVKETEEEISELRAIFDKFRAKRDQVAAPLDQDALKELDVSSNEIDALRRHGIVFGDVPPYEVPELFRRGLGLRHVGARRSVVNLYRRTRLS